jgi:hypothetical protein
MAMLSEDDLDLRDLSDEELALAWDLWFDLAQTTNDADPPYSHGVFQLARLPDPSAGHGQPDDDASA